MIKMTIEIDAITAAGLPAGVRNEFGAGVRVMTEGEDLKNASDSEGQTWVGLCTAINEYMRSRGAPKFDCLKPL